MILNRFQPARIVGIGYFLYALVGWALLLLPFCHKEVVSPLDNFFTTASAVSTTGLLSVDVGQVYSLFGQIVILILIQLGGIGYMTISSFVLLATSHKLTAFRQKIAASTFSLPKDFSLRSFIYNVIIFTLLCEGIGAIVLSLIFWRAGVEGFVWNGLFHSVSSFCTAGISLFSAGFVPFKDNFWFNLTISCLSILGSMGFIVCLDFYRKWSGQKETLSFTTKVILWVTGVFLFFGTLLFLWIEPPAGEGLFERGMASFFQVMAATTTVGFNTIDIGTLPSSLLLLLIFFSLFGSSPSGTGGGLKNTTFAALFALVKSTLIGEKTVELTGREIASKRIRIATAAYVYYGFILGVALFILNLTENKPFLPVLFEGASALNNAGLSMGLSSELSFWGKVLISLLMLIGRSGVLTLGVAVSANHETHLKKDELVL